MGKIFLGRIFSVALLAAYGLIWDPQTLAQSADAPQVAVRTLLVSAMMDTVVVAPGESADGGQSVPLTVVFEATLEASDQNVEYVMFPQWTVTRTVVSDGKETTSQFLKRQESTTTCQFTEYGQFRVDFEWSYRKAGETETTVGQSVQPMTFTIDDSEIKMYNAFSPNGDGINDVYQIYMRSIVNADIAIFNRWGQSIKSVSGNMESLMSKLNAQPDTDGGYLLELWDGTWNGSTVPDGVYFINVRATGAGGKKYNKKSDINVLKGLGTNR